MEGDLIAQVSSPVFVHGVGSLARKRDLAWTSGGFLFNHHQERMNSSSNLIKEKSWNPKAWYWDSTGFIAKPASNQSNRALNLENSLSNSDNRTREYSESLTLKLGGGSQIIEEPGGRLNKRIRPGSPGSVVNYPICQVDDCKADLSNAKDYHRRHKVCETHSKASKAVVGNQMQRFCQQCSRFHSLGEFDEGKRSCRRRLAGHNRRRRKTQPKDDSTPNEFPMLINDESNHGTGNLKIPDVLGILRHLRGNNADKSCEFDQNQSQSSEITATLTRDLLSVLSSEPRETPRLTDESGNRFINKFQFQDHLIQTPAIIIPSSPELSDHSNDESPHDLELQLFNSSDGASPPKTSSTENGSPIDDRSPSSSPPVYSLFPLQSDYKDNRPEFRLSGDPDRVMDSSSSGSDQSPSTSDSENQDRTGRIIFKLFGKDPSSFPGSLRTQILSWLSHSPTDMEGYIRPGCIVLSIYLSMPAFAWMKFERDLAVRVKSLSQSTDSDFWRKARFIVQTANQLASHRDGKIRLSKSWITVKAPEITCVSPLAVVSGEETILTIRGKNLNAPETKLHCTYMGTYTSMTFDSCFKVKAGALNLYGRFFLEVENGFKGNGFPVIIADRKICQEINALEPELECKTKIILHFLNEIGWLLQRTSTESFSLFPRFSCSRFRFLLLFSVDRDWSALVKKLLHCLMEEKLRNPEFAKEYSEMLLDIQLLHRAVIRRSRKMVDLLLRFRERENEELSDVHLFSPDAEGPGGLTPLHLAASMDDSEDIVDALTDDPQEIGLNSWSTSLDEDGKSPFYYAMMNNNHSYNHLVSRKLDRRRGEISITVDPVDPISQVPSSAVVSMNPEITLLQAIYKHCSILERRRIKADHPIIGSRIPFMHPILAIAAVCVCVCVFLRGYPFFGSVVSSFSWESLEFGPR